jgi:hypothetical protein
MYRTLYSETELDNLPFETILGLESLEDLVYLTEGDSPEFYIRKVSNEEYSLAYSLKGLFDDQRMTISYSRAMKTVKGHLKYDYRVVVVNARKTGK